MAIARMKRALDEYSISGIKTNLGLFRRILEDPDFVAARIDTGFLDRLLNAGRGSAASGHRSSGNASENVQEIAAIAAALFAATAKNAGSHAHNSNGSANPEYLSHRTATRTEQAP